MRAVYSFLLMGLLLSGCGLIYHSPTVNSGGSGTEKVRVIGLTSETVLAANRSPLQPRTLPSIFNMTAPAGGTLQVPGTLPEPVFDQPLRPGAVNTRLPPPVQAPPYRIGIGDVLLLATPQGSSSIEQLSGLLAATNARQGYTVQDDGAISIPNVGRVRIVNMTLEEAEAELFQRLVESQIDPTFSLEIAEFNSKKVAVGGAVASPGVVPVTLTPVYLDEALSQAGGITVPDPDYATVLIYRDGSLYQIPVSEIYSNRGLRRVQLLDGDSVFVDTGYALDLAESFFQQQIQLQQARQSARSAALSELSAQIGLQRAALNEARSNFQDRLEYGAEDRDYVYLTGEVARQARYPLPFGNTATLADALYTGTSGFNTAVADVRQIYVLRASPDPRDFGAVTAWQLDASNAVNLTLATRFELRPNDVIFIAEQPVTRWNRTIQQILPSLSITRQTSNLVGSTN